MPEHKALVLEQRDGGKFSFATVRPLNAFAASAFWLGRAITARIFSSVRVAHDRSSGRSGPIASKQSQTALKKAILMRRDGRTVLFDRVKDWG